MESDWLRRVRWRRRGAWMWPVFAIAVVSDAIVGHVLPPAGERQSVIAAALAGTVWTLLAIVVLSRPLGALARRLRPDLPVVVARNYAGTGLVVAVAGALLVAGLIHSPVVAQHRNAMREATARAQAWIGDRAPPRFRRNLALATTLAIEPGSIYRTCVPSTDRRQTYCVVVKPRMPLARSVTFGGYEPNSVFAGGTGY